MPDLSVFKSHVVSDRVTELIAQCKSRGATIMDAHEGFVIITKNVGDKVVAEVFEPVEAWDIGAMYLHIAQQAANQRKSKNAKPKTD